jgi:lysophospholipase L1-like esterase
MCRQTITAAILIVLSQAMGSGLAWASERRDNEPPPGFTALFNGRDLSGWRGLVADPPKRARMAFGELEKAQAAADRRMQEHWRVEDGVLVFDGKGDNLCTARDYADFELLVDWKIHEDGDSGLYLRGSPQVQIWDRPEGSGGLFNNERHASRPLIKADRPVEEWNSFRVLMRGERVTVYLNGILVVDEVPLENYWERDKPIYPSGQIELQNHGNPLYFKNIFIRELPRAEAAAPSGPLLTKGARVALVGDSITEQKLYSRYVETYLIACVPHLELRVLQLGWSGERAPGFAARLENDLLSFEPDVVTTCYGMNDGQYRPYEPGIGKVYEEAMRAIVRRLRAAGAAVVVGSPGAVDTYTFRRANLPPAVYNENLSRLRDIAREVAWSEGMPFANVHDPMVLAMLKAKPVLGEGYHVCGGDGFHPQENGHLVMAYAFLKALGLDGEIGRITLDLQGQAVASDGHRILSAAGGRVEIESSRYPFCFQGDNTSPSSTRSILPFVSFQRELNRLMLVVRNLGAPRARVSWGGAEKSYSREQLEAGINLAAEFLDNPFSAAFKGVDELVAAKQRFETPMIKEHITRIPERQALLGTSEGAQALESLRSSLLAADAALHAVVRVAVRPVRHTLVVVPE